MMKELRARMDGSEADGSTLAMDMTKNYRAQKRISRPPARGIVPSAAAGHGPGRRRHRIAIDGGVPAARTCPPVTDGGVPAARTGRSATDGGFPPGQVGAGGNRLRSLTGRCLGGGNLGGA